MNTIGRIASAVSVLFALWLNSACDAVAGEPSSAPALPLLKEDRANEKGEEAGSAERLDALVREEGPSSAAADRPAPRTDENSRIAHRQLLEKARLGTAEGRIDVYFVGDSITRRWGCSDPQYRDLLDSWNKNFFGWNAANFGWGGDTTRNILWRLENGELEGLCPKVFVIQAGTNNLGPNPDGTDAAEIARGVKAIVETCRRKAPNARVILTAVFPRNDNRAALPAIREINRIIEGFCDGERIRFLNINDKLADASGELLDGMMMDGLHPTRRGYEVWARGLKPILTEWLGPPAKVDHAPPPTGDPSVMKRAD